MSHPVHPENLPASPHAIFVDPSVAMHACLDGCGFPPRTAGDASSAFLISSREGVLDLRPPGEHDRPGIRALFPPDRGAAERGGDAKNPLVRAFGKRIDFIHDLTAGLGGDAYRLARAGYSVSAVEREPAVYALLASAWDDARKSGAVAQELSARLSFRCADGEQEIESIEGLNRGVYIDPMYPPPRRASAKPRRELQVLRALIPPQQDARVLVERARERAARVVVKRPPHAESLVAGPSHVIESKLVRFDVYVNPERLSPMSEVSA